jgi:hypothetical protein
LAKCSATNALKGYTVDEPTTSILSRASADAAKPEVVIARAHVSRPGAARVRSIVDGLFI